MFRFVALLAIASLAAWLSAAQPLPGPVPAEVLRVIDGDTVLVRARIWIRQTVDVSVRIAGIDTPEIMRPSCTAERDAADKAKRTVEALIGNEVTLHNIRLGKYAGRVVADVRTEDGIDLGAHLLDIGEAVPEGARDPWCDAPPTPFAGTGTPDASRSPAP